MTSNVGAEMIKREAKLGFAVKKDEIKDAEKQFSEIKDKLLDQLKRAVPARVPQPRGRDDRVPPADPRARSARS